VLLDLVLTNKGLVGEVKVGSRLGCSDHEMVEFRILHGGSRELSRISTLDFRKGNFGLFRGQLGGIPWIRAPEMKGRGWGGGCPREMFFIQASLPPALRLVHLYK